MASTPTADQVKSIIDVKVTDVLTPFITAAEILVDGVCIDDSDGAFTYSDALRLNLKMWASAHYYAILRGRQKFRSAGKVQESIESKVDLYLNETRYGTTLITLDIYGRLAAFNNDLQKARGNLSVYQQTITYLGDYDEEVDGLTSEDTV